MKRLKPTTRNSLGISVIIVGLFICWTLLVPGPVRSGGIPFRNWMRGWFNERIAPATGIFKPGKNSSSCDPGVGGCGVTATINSIDPPDSNLVDGQSILYPKIVNGVVGWWIAAKGLVPLKIFDEHEKLGSGAKLVTGDATGVVGNVPRYAANGGLEDGGARGNWTQIFRDYEVNVPTAWTDKLLGGQAGSTTVPTPGQIVAMSIGCYNSTGVYQNADCTTSGAGCITAEAYVNATDTLSTDCDIADLTSHCFVEPADGTRTFAAGDIVSMRITTGDLVAAVSDCVFTMWVDYD